jgi:hypothetical protein
MKLKSTLYFLFIFFFLVACKKKNIEVNETIQCTPTLNPVPSADTILPSDYMPAYPGSYWTLVYNSQNGSTTKTINANGWEQTTCYFPTSLDGCGFFDTKTSFIPSISGGVPSIWGNQILNSFNSSNTTPKPFGLTVFSTENLDTTFYQNFSNSGSTKRVVQTYSYSEFTLNNTTYQDVKLVSITDWEYSFKYGEYMANGASYYFAKDVGLIQMKNYKTFEIFILSDYYIAPH